MCKKEYVRMMVFYAMLIHNLSIGNWSSTQSRTFFWDICYGPSKRYGVSTTTTGKGSVTYSMNCNHKTNLMLPCVAGWIIISNSLSWSICFASVLWMKKKTGTFSSEISNNSQVLNLLKVISVKDLYIFIDEENWSNIKSLLQLTTHTRTHTKQPTQNKSENTRGKSQLVYLCIVKSETV